MNNLQEVVRAELGFRNMRKPGENIQVAKMAQKLFLEHAREVAHVLVEIALDEDAKASDRISAVKEIHERAYGKSVSMVDMKVNHQHEMLVSEDTLKGLSDEKLQEAINLLQNLMPDEAIDVTPDK
jgi:hypothetical protein